MGNLLFHLQFEAPQAANTLLLRSFFESLDGWQAYATGTAVINRDVERVTMITGLTGGSIATIGMTPQYCHKQPTWAKNRTIQAKMRLDVKSDASSLIYVHTGNSSTNQRGFGLKFENTKIRGWSQNGGAKVYTDLVTGLTAPYAREETYKIIFTAATKIEFYIDNVLTGSIASGLPTGTVDADDLFKITLYNGTTVSHEAYISYVEVEQEL